jgi:DNA repair protein RecO (recombination protein O)
MDTRVSLQPAYVLHTRPFQNTSLLVDFFTTDYGRLRAIAKGARSAKSKYRSLLQLFQPLLISYSGRGEVKTVASIESSHGAIHLQADRLFSGLYINELLTRLLHLHVEHHELFNNYQEVLVGLQGELPIELVLRKFELNLLAELGYAINLESDCGQHEPLDAKCMYKFIPDVGFDPMISPPGQSEALNLFSGTDLIALREFKLENEGTAKSAKRLLRLALNAHLGEKPLNSRKLFVTKS